MSVLSEWLAKSRMKPGAVLAPGATMMPTGDPGWMDRNVTDPNRIRALQQSSRTVLVAEEKAIPIVIVPKELFPPSIIPPGIQFPTALVVGTEQSGGVGIPHTTGPWSVAHEEWPLGSILFYTGNRVAISIGIYDKGESFQNLIISYHRRGVRLRVHTGVSKVVNSGPDAREGPGGVGEPERPGPLVPYGRPDPPRNTPDGGFEGGLDRFLERNEDSISQTDPWVPIIPGLPFNRPTLKQLEDTLRYWASWGDEIATWQ